MPLHEFEELRVRPGSVRQVLSHNVRHVWPEAAERGDRVLAAFIPAFAPSPTLLVLHEFDDLTAFERTRVAAADPSHRSQALLELDEMVDGATSRLLLPSPWWHLRPIPATGIFTLRTFRVQPGAAERFHRLTGEVIWPTGSEVDRGGFLGLWSTVVGETSEIVMFSQYESFAHWEKTRPEADAGATEEQVVAFQQARAERDEKTLWSDVRAYRRLPGWPE